MGSGGHERVISSGIVFYISWWHPFPAALQSQRLEGDAGFLTAFRVTGGGEKVLRFNFVRTGCLKSVQTVNGIDVSGAACLTHDAPSAADLHPRHRVRHRE